MVKEINGVSYNTEKSKWIGDYYNEKKGIYKVYEALYQTNDGLYFLDGVGGWGTIYAKEKIIPLTENDAYKWADRPGVQIDDPVFKTELELRHRDGHLQDEKNRSALKQLKQLKTMLTRPEKVDIRGSAEQEL